MSDESFQQAYAKVTAHSVEMAKQTSLISAKQAQVTSLMNAIAKLRSMAGEDPWAELMPIVEEGHRSTMASLLRLEKVYDKSLEQLQALYQR